jgi:spermidine synthase
MDFRAVECDLIMPSPGKGSPIKAGKKKNLSFKHSPLPVPVVSQQGDVLTLHFGSDYIESQMVVGKPDFLAFAYTRIMMTFEMFIPLPREIGLIGLGGGSIAKWCYRHHPKTKLTVVEINPHVIAVREAFQIPQDDRRSRILCEDGGKFVAETSTRFDVLLVDCFAADHYPQELCSREFYAHCNSALTESGLLVVNLCVKNHQRILSRIDKSFGGRMLFFPDGDGNIVVFACKGRLLWSKGEDAISFRRKLKRFEEKYGLGRAMAPRG